MLSFQFLVKFRGNVTENEIFGTWPKYRINMLKNTLVFEIKTSILGNKNF